MYLRQSLDRKRTGEAVERQRKACLDLAAAKGWKITGTYVDNDTSASTTKPRPAYRQMLKDAESGRFGAVVAYHPDRLARRVTDFEELIVRSQRDRFTIATVTGDLDLSNDMGRLVGRMLAAIATGEVERKGARQSLAAAQTARAGRPHPGRRPIGYEVGGLVVRESEARIIRAGYRDLLNGTNLSAVARSWNRAGLTTITGEPWKPVTARKLLLRSRYAGIRSYNGDEITSAAWEPIVDEVTYRGAVAVLSDPSRRLSQDNHRRYLLSGLARCGVCGALMATGRTSAGARTYRCGATRHLSVAADRIDQHVLETAAARLAASDAASWLSTATGPDAEAVRAEAVALTARLDELVALFTAGAITGAQLATGSESLRSKLDAAHASMADASRVDALGDLVGADDILGKLQERPVDRQRVVIETLAAITLHSPGRGVKTFNPANVEVAWLVGQ